jgi:hypothetical protein
MANQEHLKILREGVEAWNKWRVKNSKTKPDFSDTDFFGLNLAFANLANANLTHTNLSQSELTSAILAGAGLAGSRLDGAYISRADFSEADLICVDFSGADLSKTNFFGANLFGADFTSAKLAGSNFENAATGNTIFAATDLKDVKGLNSVRHFAPSSIGIDTLYASQGKIPEKFLRDAGVSEEVIEHLLPAIRVGSPIQWNSCFISYSNKDKKFAERLHARMRQSGLRVWFAPEDMKGGDYFFEQIERAIQLHDRLLLVLSEDSIQSKWVEREIKKARKVERAEKRRKLFPITLTDYATLKKWECLDSDTGEDLAEEVRKYHIPDFSNWKNHDAFERAFARLEKDLRTSLGK